MAGTNGRIMYSSNSFSLGLDRSVIIPTDRFLSWKPFRDDGDWTLKLGLPKKDGPASFEISSFRWRYFSREIEGIYPNYRQVVPRASDCQTTIEFDPVELGKVVQAIQRMPSHDPVNHTIQLQVRGQEVALLGKSPGAEQWTEVALQPIKARGREVKIAFNRQYLIRALSFGLNQMQIIDAMSPARFSNGGRQMVVMPIRAEAAPTHVPAAKPGASSEAPPQAAQPSSEEKPVATSTPADRTPPTERNQPMRNTTATSAAADPDNGSSTNGHAESPATLSTALERIETIKGSYREAIRGLNDLADLLKQTAREQKASEKEISSVRQTLRSLQSVRL